MDHLMNKNMEMEPKEDADDSKDDTKIPKEECKVPLIEPKIEPPKNEIKKQPVDAKPDPAPRKFGLMRENDRLVFKTPIIDPPKKRAVVAPYSHLPTTSTEENSEVRTIPVVIYFKHADGTTRSFPSTSTATDIPRSAEVSARHASINISLNDNSPIPGPRVRIFPCERLTKRSKRTKEPPNDDDQEKNV